MCLLTVCCVLAVCPDYAVCFFVKAFHQSDTSGQHVERDFFRIPTYTREEGNFVYAIPKGHQVGDIDTQLKDRAAVLLEEYKQWRPRYLRVDNTLRAQELIMYFVRDKRIN